MTKLHQIIAVESGVKNTAEKEFTDLDKKLQKLPLLNGISRSYQPDNDEGDQLPSESSPVQVTVEQTIKDVAETLERYFDVTFVKEVGNTKAKADVVVDGKTLLKEVPVTYLLFLDKKMTDLHTFVLRLPVLDPASQWSPDGNTGVQVTPPVVTVKTKKVRRNWERSPATKEHPAQVDIFEEDLLVGRWTKRDYSGAITAERKKELVTRVTKLQTAVKFAREEANELVVDDLKIANKVFGYLFS